VPRPRLVRLLNEGLHASRKLTLVSAPPGFGKTTLLVDWLRQIDRPAAWLSLEEADNDLPRFTAYLATAFQQVDEEVASSLLSASRAPQRQAIEKALTALLNEIALRTEPLILVLDDYHLLNEPAILEMMELLLHHQPPQLRPVLTTREDPDLPLAKLRARDQLVELRARDLRFTQEETAAFLRDVMGLRLSTAEAAALEDRTEGWVVGLQLAGLSIQKQADVESFIADFSGSHRHILDYLTDEVLQRQPEDIRTFLLQTSILDRLSGPLCDALTGRTDGERRLAQLEAANLFVTPLDEERRWYRYHHLFADLLRSQLTRSQPEWIPELHRRASRWYEENGDIHAAVDHALEASDPPQLTRLIEQHTFPKLYQGEVTKVVAWFDRLPEAILRPAPMLCICKAWALALLQRGARREEVEQALSAADLALDRANADGALRDQIAGHAASIRAFLLRIPSLKEGQPGKLIALSQEALRLLPPEAKAIRSTAALNMGYGFLALADLESASMAFGQTLEDGLSGGNFYAAVYGPINLIICTLLEGRLGEALRMCKANLERFNRIVAGQHFPPIGALHILRGNILLECGRLEEAEQALTEGLDLVRWIGESVAPKKGYTALARLRAIQGDRPAAMEAVKALEESWPEGSLYAQALRHRLSIRHWPDDPDVRKEARAWLAKPEIGFDQLAAIAGVDPLSASIFEYQINAAHVLARLAKGGPGSFPLDMLHAGLTHVQDFAVSHGFVSWYVEIAIARILLDQAAAKKAEALETLQAALRSAAHTGLLRVFLDEYDPLQALLRELKPRLTDKDLIAYADGLLEGMDHQPSMPETGDRREMLLSQREREVLRCLAQGLSYEEIGRSLFLSLNTVQFHVKNVYRKLLVNKRVQAIERARQLQLI
jgi:LuxR family maltose regulon positive regulatory protein